MRLTIAYSKTKQKKKKKRNLMLINNDTYQRETVSERPIRQPLKFETVFSSDKKCGKLTVSCIPEQQRYGFSVIFNRTFFCIIFQCEFECTELFSVFFRDKFS